MPSQNQLRIRDILDRLDTTESPLGCNKVDYLLREFHIDCGWVDIPEGTITERPIDTWICTDTEVGFYAIYLHGELVCVSKQLVRKSHVTFKWVSKETFEKVRSFIMSLTEDLNFAPEIIEMDEIIDVDRTREFLSELTNEDEPTFDGKPVKLLLGKTILSVRDTGKSHWAYEKVLIETEGVEREVKIVDLHFPIKLRNSSRPG